METNKTDLKPLPEEFEDHEVPSQEIALRQEDLTRLTMLDPQMIAKRLEAREQTLATLRAVAIRSTHPFDWTLYKDKADRVVGVLRDSGAVQIRKWLGISIFDYKPVVNGVARPEVVTTKDKDGVEQTVATMWADGLCALTGEPVEGISYAVRLGADFTGSGSMQDLLASCRTGLDTKITRILSGLRKVPEETLVKLGVETSKSHRGMGFGTSSERTSQKVAEEGVPEQAAALRDDILRRVGGDMAAAKKLCKEITSAKKKDGTIFAGFETVDRLTQGWQVEQAVAALKKHPIFGDNAGREPGGEG